MNLLKVSEICNLLTVETTLLEDGNHWEDSSHAVDLFHLNDCIQSTYFLWFYDVMLTEKSQ